MKVNFEGTITAVKPRINLFRSFDQIWHAYKGYILVLKGTVAGNECDPLRIAVGPKAHEEYQFCIGDKVSGDAATVEDSNTDKGLIHHSDRGSQYCAHGYYRLLEQFGIKASMSRKGNCYDNAPMESFWGTLKNELVYHRRYTSRREAINDITEYIEVFYNRQRRQARLGYLSPAAYEKLFYEKRIAA